MSSITRALAVMSSPVVPSPRVAARVAWMQVRKHYPELAEMDAGELMEYQAVEYYKLQEDRKRYFESQGRDASNVLPGWPMLG